MSDLEFGFLVGIATGLLLPIVIIGGSWLGEWAAQRANARDANR